ncbi:MAG: DUF4337 domain-containing protein [Deltaproteobacteria bacterium]|nr:DUF4337 domain-containing protein [Deltaproteobacteria bacterium]
MPTPETPAAPQSPTTSPTNAPVAKKDWTDNVARTTAVLAVLAAMSSGQYAGQFSRTILSQAEVTDKWSYYQAKSIKRSLKQSEIDLARAMALGKPELAEQFAKVEDGAKAKIKEYEGELTDIQNQARALEADKERHRKQGLRFQLAFILLQVGVVLSTIASSSKKRELWVLAILAGVLGLIVTLDAFLLITAKAGVPMPVMD